MKTISFYIAVFFSFLLANASFGQSRCANTLYEANKSFEAGDFSRSVSLLQPCLKSGFNREEKFEGYRLLAMDYIYLNQLEKADTAVRNMLQKKPSYKEFPNISDPAGLSNLIGNYSVSPQLTGGVNLGFNYTLVNLIANKEVASSPASYTPLIWYQYGGELDYAIYKGFHVSAGLQVSDCRYEHDIDNVAGWQQQYTEDLTYIQVPVTLRYFPLKQKSVFQPYVEAGAAFSSLIADNASIMETDVSGNGNTNSHPIDPSSRRVKSNTSLLFGAGLRYKISGGWITADARYLNGLNLIDIPANRYNDQDLIFNYQYADDDFKFNKWMFTVGFTFALSYKIEKTGK